MIRLAEPYFEDEDKKAVLDVLDSGWLVQGKRVQEFEELTASYVGTQHAIAVNSGTSAIYLALLALGIGPGDEVITSDFTFPATTNAIELTGAKPVLVDIDIATYNIDVSQIEGKISEKTRAIMPVHLFGQMANMEPILKLAKEKGLSVVEDAAPALGAKQTIADSIKMAGAIGDLGCFSFHPRKTITTGEGGMITTNNDYLADKLRKLRNHGQQ